MRQPDERTTRYLDGVLRNVGHIASNYSHYSIAEILERKGLAAPVLVTRYPNYSANADVSVYKYDTPDGIHYCAEIGYQTDIDDYIIETHIFARCPSEQDIQVTRLAQSIRKRIQFEDLSQEYNCCECGRHIHWTQTKPSGLVDKYNIWQDGLCGYCD